MKSLRDLGEEIYLTLKIFVKIEFDVPATQLIKFLIFGKWLEMETPKERRVHIERIRLKQTFKRTSKNA